MYVILLVEVSDMWVPWVKDIVSFFPSVPLSRLLSALRVNVKGVEERNKAYFLIEHHGREQHMS